MRRGGGGSRRAHHSGAPGSRRLVHSKVQPWGGALGEEDGPFGGAPCTCSAAITKSTKVVAVVGSQWEQLQERRKLSNEPPHRYNCIAKIGNRGEGKGVDGAREGKKTFLRLIGAGLH